MGMPVWCVGDPEVGQRTGAPPVRCPPSPHGDRPTERPRSPAARGTEWSSFVARCLRSWEQARASATEFLATWTPLHLPEPIPALVARPDGARRKASRVDRAGASTRTAAAPRSAGGHERLDSTDRSRGAVDPLRERYPLVTAMLIELAALSRRGTVAPSRRNSAAEPPDTPRALGARRHAQRPLAGRGARGKSAHALSAQASRRREAVQVSAARAVPQAHRRRHGARAAHDAALLPLRKRLPRARRGARLLVRHGRARIASLRRPGDGRRTARMRARSAPCPPHRP